MASTVDEKQDYDAAVSASPSTSEAEYVPNKSAERKLVWKLDLRVLPVIYVLYFVNFLDRANIGNAKIAGMSTELKLIGQRYNIAVWVFNLGYLVAGIPTMIVFKRFGPKMLPIVMFIWGLFVLGSGFVKSWEGLVACRLLEGIFEAGLIPGATYIISSYYTETEYLNRTVVFFTAGILAGAFNGLISSQIMKLNGNDGYEAWSWIFIVEGIITCIVALISWFFIVPFPQKATFLSLEEKELLHARKRAEGGDIADGGITLRLILHHLKDWKIWAATFAMMGVTESANSIINFQPTVLLGLGYKANAAQVHTIPVYIVGAVASVIFCWASAILKQRYIFYCVGVFILMIGLAVEIAQPHNPKVRYMGLFFMTSGAYTSQPISLVWCSLNIKDAYKRAVAMGAIVNLGTAGAFISSNVFLAKESPIFHTGFSVGLGLACVGFVAATAMFVGMYLENKRRDKQAGGVEGAHIAHGAITSEDDPAWRYRL